MKTGNRQQDFGEISFQDFPTDTPGEAFAQKLSASGGSAEEKAAEFFSAVDAGLITEDDLEFVREFGDFDDATLVAASKRDPLTYEIWEELKWRGWYDKTGSLFNGEEIVASLNSLGEAVVEPNLVVDDKDGKTYAKVFASPMEGMLDYSDSRGTYRYANVRAIEDGVVATPFGEGHARIRSEWPETWIEVPILDRFGKPTNDALLLADDLETLRHFPLLNEDHFQEVVRPSLNED